MVDFLPQLSVLRDAAGPRVVGRSPGVSFETEEAVLRMVVRYGTAPSCPPAVFRTALAGTPFWVLATVGQLPGDGSPLAFRVVVGPRPDVATRDPFDFRDRHPADGAKGDLPPLEWPLTAPPRRTVEVVRTILQAGESALMLGAAQALLDGGKIAVGRADVPTTFVRDLWHLLPDLSRNELSFASDAPTADVRFDVAVLPTVPAEGIRGFLTAEQVRDYPEGRYELTLQRAAENEDQGELDRLFARKTSSQILYMVVGMIVFAFVAVALLKLI